jgi:serine/threonine-protein kinase
MPTVTTLYCPSCNSPISPGTKFCASCGHQLVIDQSVAQDPLVGQILGDRFRVEAKLGEGGMGAVYQAEQVAMKRKVALKVLHPHLAQDESLIERFHREAGAAARLNHPNTITVHDFGQTADGTLYIAMEFVDGKSLADETETGQPFPWTRAVHVAHQIAESLTDAHSEGIVHRDLKPDNVMLINRAGQSDFVKLLDFGIAKVAEASEEDGDKRKALTKTGMIFGTPQYMSPEQIRGSGVDHRTDIYALGVIVYQFLTGQLPFQAENPLGMLTKHLMEPPRPMRYVFPGLDCPPQLEVLVFRCLEKDASRRYQSMAEIVQELSALTGDTRPGFAMTTPPVGQGVPQALTTAPGVMGATQPPGTYAHDNSRGFTNTGAGGFAAQGSGGFGGQGSGGFAAPGSGGFAAPGSGGFAAPGSGGFAAPGSGGFGGQGSGGFVGVGSNAGMTPAPATPPTSGGAGRTIVLLLIIIVVLAGLGVGGAFAWRALSSNDGEDDTPNVVAQNDPQVQDPQVLNPQIQDPQIQNPQIQNPQIQNPQIQNPQIQNPQVQNPQIQNPQVQDPALTNPPIETPSKNAPCEVAAGMQGSGKNAKASDESKALANAFAAKSQQISLCVTPLAGKTFDGNVKISYNWSTSKGPRQIKAGKNTLGQESVVPCLETVIQMVSHPESKSASAAVVYLEAVGDGNAITACKVTALVPARRSGRGPKPPDWVPGQPTYPTYPNYPNYGGY